MKAQHTPGPWEVSGNGIWAVSQWNARFRLATVTTPSPMNGVDWEANAKLIAAAPKMLEALESIIRIAALRDDNVERPEGLFELLRDAAGTARGAIAEATGQETAGAA